MWEPHSCIAQERVPTENKRVAGLVSVVIPCWNRQAYIKECLQQLAHQVYKNIEIIIVDDASTDGTMKVARQWKSTQRNSLQSRVCIVGLPRNVGYAGAMSIGMYLARGEFIALHDSDDYSHPLRLQKQVHYFRRHANMGILGTNYRVVSGGHVRWKEQPSWIAFGSSNVRSRYKAGSHCITVGSVMLRGRLFDMYGALNRRVKGAEDWEIIDRYLSRGVNADNLRDVLYFVRRHGAQRSKQFYRVR